MRPAERIPIIKECATSLSSRADPEIQLTLRQFGFPTYDFNYSWNGSGIGPYEYCMDQIEKGEDSALAELYEYLLSTDKVPPAPGANAIWENLPGRVFLSHIHKSREFAGKVRGILSARFGIDAFVAHDNIHPSRRWCETIKSALASCHIFVALLDDGFHASQWCDQEVGWALARRIPILPVQPAGFDRTVKRDGFLEEHQDVCLDSAGSYPHAWLAQQIFQSFIAHSQTQEIAIKVVVEALVHSPSFETTRRLWKIIERHNVVESDQLRRLEYAMETNRQVYEAVADSPGHEKIPDLIGALIQKFEPSVYEKEPF